MPRLTKRFVESLRPDPAKETFAWDADVKGFGVRILRSGRKTFLFQYAIGRRKSRVTVGVTDSMTTEDAREVARDLYARVKRGEDPAATIRQRRNAQTVSDLCDRFMAEHVETHCKPTTIGDYGNIIEKYIRPELGHLLIADIRRADVAALHHRMHGRKFQANRMVAVVSKMFNLAELWGLRPDGTNPTRHVKRYKEASRSRYLSDEEIARLWHTLDELERDGTYTPHQLGAFRLLLLTGCRVSEIQFLKWEFVREDRFELPDSKTGARTIFLSDAAMEALFAIPRIVGNPYVVAGFCDGAAITDLEKPWRTIRARADIPDVRIHDLRHTFASVAAGQNVSLAIIGGLLGHKSTQTTARYAHLASRPLKSATNRVGDVIGDITNRATLTPRLVSRAAE